MNENDTERPPDTLRVTAPPEPTNAQILARVEDVAHAVAVLTGHVLELHESHRGLPCRHRQAAE